MNFKETIRSDLKVKLADMKLVCNGNVVPIVIDRIDEEYEIGCLPVYTITAYGAKDCKNLSIVPKPARVIFHNPATVIYWEDGTKTVVKCQPGDTYDKEKGVALCYMKKILGNMPREFNKALKKWVK